MRGSLLLCGIAAASLLFVCLLRGQSPTPGAPVSAASNFSPNPGAVLRVRVDLVLVPVVVRDLSGHAVGSLRAEDFSLLDNNKPQQIVSFAIDKPASRPIAETGSGPAGTAAPVGPGRAFVAPRGFTAIYFDDVHLETENMTRVRAAARRYLAKVDFATERIGIFTT